MLVWRGKVPGVPSPLSLGTYVEQVSSSLSTRFRPHSIAAKNLITTTPLSSSHFKTLNSLQKQQISVYVDALLHWNQKMNLTAVRDTTEVMERHVGDSLAMIPPIQSSYIAHCDSSYNNISLVDVGSGPGLPGLILAIACPSWKITLLESINKRCIFLEHAVSLTGLSNVQVVRGRAEDLGQSIQFREVFDVAVARAVAEMRILAEYCLPLVRVGGLFLAAKGHDPQEEVRNAERAIKLMGGSLFQQCSVESHSPYGQRTAIICLKDRPTPSKYPRDPGTPAKSPL